MPKQPSSRGKAHAAAKRHLTAHRKAIDKLHQQLSDLADPSQRTRLAKLVEHYKRVHDWFSDDANVCIPPSP